MNSRLVHSVIAAGLESPALLELWQQEPERLRQCGVDPAQFDFDVLRKFAGLTAKIRHNGLRWDFPLTFRFLNIAGLEIEVFAAYAAFRTNNGEPYAHTTQDRAQELLSFLGDWLDLKKRAHRILWDLIRYELALSRLGKQNNARSATGRARSVSRAAGIPRIRGHVILHEMSCDPKRVAAILQPRSPALDKIRLGRFYFCFWRSESAEIQILQLDELGFYLLTLADGTRSAADISFTIGAGRRPSQGLVKALSELASIGILSFETIQVRRS